MRDLSGILIVNVLVPDEDFSFHSGLMEHLLALANFVKDCDCRIRNMFNILLPARSWDCW